MPRQNYRQIKKQKELSRKARQLEKQQRRTSRPNAAVEGEAPSQDGPVNPNDSAPSGAT